MHSYFCFGEILLVEQHRVELVDSPQRMVHCQPLDADSLGIAE